MECKSRLSENKIAHVNVNKIIFLDFNVADFPYLHRIRIDLLSTEMDWGDRQKNLVLSVR